MTTATERVNIALITMAAQGQRPRCADFETTHLWTSDHEQDRAVAARLCVGCPILSECGDEADEIGEQWYVRGGRDYTRRKKAAA